MIPLEFDDDNDYCLPSYAMQFPEYLKQGYLRYGIAAWENMLAQAYHDLTILEQIKLNRTKQ